jgi:hypothetical protein
MGGIEFKKKAERKTENGNIFFPFLRKTETSKKAEKAENGKRKTEIFFQ